MNVTQKSSLTIVLATMITSILIIMSSKSVAEDIAKGKPDSNIILENVIQKVTSKIPVTSTKITTNLLKEKNGHGKKLLAPPPGPFLVGGAAKLAQKAPVAPVSVTEMPANQLGQPVAPRVPSLSLTKPQLKVEVNNAPQFTKDVPNSAATPVQKSIVPVLKAQASKAEKKEPSEPIWMQKPPTINTHPKLQYFNRNVPASGLAPQMGQQYIYIPMPTYPTNYNYSVMPNNGAYYYQQQMNVPVVKEHMIRGNTSEVSSDIDVSKPIKGME